MGLGIALLLLALQTKRPAPPPDLLPGTAIVRGHAFSTSTGTPLKRARVVLSMKGQSTPRSTITARDGAYEFVNIAAGSYTVQCSKKGYLSAGYGSKGPDQPPTPVAVLDRQEFAAIDCRLQHNGSINGNIIDEDGEPLSDVDVSALIRTFRNGQPTYTRAATIKSDDHGHYRLYELPPGRYCLQAWRGPLQSESALAPVFYPNSPRVNDCQWLDLRHGDEASHIDLTLRETPTYAVRGRVNEARSGRNMSGTAIRVIPEDFGGDERAVIIAPNNMFEIGGLIPARYRLDIAIMENGERHWSKIIEISDADQEVTLTPGLWARIAGQIRPVVSGKTDVLPPGMKIRLTAHDANREPSRVSFEPASVNAGGAFVFDGVPIGNYDLGIEGLSSKPYFIADLSSGGPSLLDRGITVGDGDRYVAVTVTLDFQPSAISGRVLDEDGKPLSGAGLVAWNSDREKQMQNRYFKTAFSDASGSYLLSNLPPGEYYVAVWTDYDPWQALEPDVLRRLEGHAVRVNAVSQTVRAEDLRVDSDTRSIPASFVR